MINGIIFQAHIPIPMDPQWTDSNALKELLPLQGVQLSFRDWRNWITLNSHPGRPAKLYGKQC